MFKVKFVVHKKNANLQMIKVVGNLPILGNWNPMNGLQLQQYEQGQWESLKYVQIQNGQQFQFKLVRIINNSQVQWEQLPNNSNRKFKPKYNSRLILTWSSHIGKALNEAKSSMKLKGLPGVMVKGYNQAGMLKKNPLKNKIILSDSDSQQQNPNDSFNVGRKKSSDIRQSINSGDIEEIYYDTTQLQNAYQSYKQIHINIVSSHKKEASQFIQKIQQQLKNLHQLQNFKFKWLILNEQEGLHSKLQKRISLKKIQKNKEQKIYLQQYDTKSFQKNHFIFLDLEAAIKTQVGNTSACLYLPSYEFQQAKQILEDLQKFQFISFDNPQYNKMLLQIFENRQFENEEQKQPSLLKKKSIQKPQKQIYSISLEKIIEELQFCQTQVAVNTVCSFTKQQALTNILVSNSILFIDSDLMKTDRTFFDKLMNFELEKRLVVIIHKSGTQQWIYSYANNKNVCIILQNFTKLYFIGKLYDPSNKHRAAIDFIQMRAKLFQKQFGGSWKMEESCFTFQFNQGTLEKASKIKTQIQKYLTKELNYFKLSFKQNKLKITWNLSHNVRLLKTLIRLKFMQQGKIGNFFIVSQKQNFTELKQEIQLLIDTNSLLMCNGKETKILDLGFRRQSNAKYNIKRNEQQSTIKNCSNQKIEDKIYKKQKKQKKLQFLQKCSS